MEGDVVQLERYSAVVSYAKAVTSRAVATRAYGVVAPDPASFAEGYGFESCRLQTLFALLRLCFALLYR